MVKPAGAFAASSSFTRYARIAAWGHTNVHWLHCRHLLGSQWGIAAAMPRLSYLDVPMGYVPS